ncbi:MAG: 1-deoxy-D-xylulose-5-phosphate synthase [Candidatus Moranbacteria bacterium GW2011_GWF2_36_839]|nr:MAG: 1-deoxy-D-xylulose-5-phosphate synthase [Candidatus Moranbacteria bacterium GW2011_GWF2_36_839]HAT73584.1 1-deoxy-D-xylulose-5-phosphate synthase [Candidatus Moranbacteria bacterium]HBY10605.1 1-deoxy-D-xylulose-5-phosphate synthase [Candidatus Moranbacteria bacterium]
MEEKKAKKLLDAINFPVDLKKIPAEKLPELCAEVRDFLVESVSKSGGHFGSNLGVVELAVALHYIFDTPKDKLIWDVGHQAYPHKMLTGRKDKLHTIRKKGGLAPFPKKTESEYDACSVGHTSTSISSAVGMALANRNKKNAPQIVAVIGDGALAGGMAFEALNHAGDVSADMLVVLNDNKMSISPNVGGLEKYLTKIISSSSFVSVREKGRKFFSHIPILEKFLRRAEKQAKGMLVPSTLFEQLGFEYYGPIDGHDVKNLTEVLENLKNIRGPKFLHVVTTKGKGYKHAENDGLSLHAVAPFDPETGKKNGGSTKKITFSDVFSDWICEKARKDEKLHAITPAMADGSGLIEFRKKFPNRFHDVGIAEQHAVTFSAGLSAQGAKPVVSIYSSFLQRAYDQIIHDVALENLDVLFAIDRAGVVGPDGATHNGSFDLSFLRAVPNLVIMTPSCENECFAMLSTGYKHKGPAVVRYPRGGGSGKYNQEKYNKLEIGKAKIIRSGKKLAILSFGTLLENCKKTTEVLDATLVDMRFVKPLDEEMLKNLSQTHKYFVTIEDNVIAGGAGSAVNEFLAKENLKVSIRNIGLPDKFLEHGTREELLKEVGLDEDGILESVKSFIS